MKFIFTSRRSSAVRTAFAVRTARKAPGGTEPQPHARRTTTAPRERTEITTTAARGKPQISRVTAARGRRPFPDGRGRNTDRSRADTRPRLIARDLSGFRPNRALPIHRCTDPITRRKGRDADFIRGGGACRIRLFGGANGL